MVWQKKATRSTGTCILTAVVVGDDQVQRHVCESFEKQIHDDRIASNDFYSICAIWVSFTTLKQPVSFNRDFL